ncbi:hypothetical protein L842_1791 [Mycobacterium intracellulare MIN_052511_1280]|nr:hypothetical protein L842_1791 [Mycobacterium intracellulare MIN_052511_1280]
MSTITCARRCGQFGILRMRNKWRERLCASSADSIGYPSMRRCDSTDGSH